MKQTKQLGSISRRRRHLRRTNTNTKTKTKTKTKTNTNTKKKKETAKKRQRAKTAKKRQRAKTAKKRQRANLESKQVSVYGISKKTQFDNDYSVNIINKRLSSETSFGGYPLDLLFGIIYLKRKYPKKFAMPFDIRQLLETYSTDLEDRRPFTFIGCLFYKCKESIIRHASDSKTSYKFNATDFELELPGKASINKFKGLLNKAIANKKRFTIIPLIFRWSCLYEFEGHANLLFFDFENMTCERFEPYGWISHFTKEEMAVSNSFNNVFLNFIKSLNIQKNGQQLTYVDQYKMLKVGPQFIEEEEVEKAHKKLAKESDPEGFCGAWSLWLADLVLKQPDKPRYELVKKAINVMKKSDKTLRSFIRNYSQFLVKERHKLLKKIRQSNPYNHILRDQLRSLEDKKSAVSKLVKTQNILENRN
jgi:hypothetical protein